MDKNLASASTLLKLGRMGRREPGERWRGDGPCEFGEYCCLACNPADLEVSLLLAPFLQL